MLYCIVASEYSLEKREQKSHMYISLNSFLVRRQKQVKNTYFESMGIWVIPRSSCGWNEGSRRRNCKRKNKRY